MHELLVNSIYLQSHKYLIPIRDAKLRPMQHQKCNVCVLVAKSCPTLCNPMDCSPPGSSVHGILQARILEWVAVPFSRGSSRPRDQTQVSCVAGRFFIVWATREAAGQVIESPGTQDKEGGCRLPDQASHAAPALIPLWSWMSNSVLASLSLTPVKWV